MDQNRRRPLTVTLLALAVFLLSVGNGLRFFTGLARYSLLKELGLAVPPEYLILSGAIWAVASLALAVGLWRGMRIARTLALPLLLIYLAQTWLDRLVLSVSSTTNLNWPFALAVHGVAMGAMIWILLRREAKRFFGDLRLEIEQSQVL